ncbi:MAG: hypothetical protein GY801_32150 [bacterium]|nr:hypothetical protein [bacterium]
MKSEHRQHALENHIRRIAQGIQELEAKRERFARHRALILFSGIALSYWAGWFSLIFAILLVTIEASYYSYIGRILRRHQLWKEIKSTHLARMRLDWKNIPEPPQISPDEEHPFEVDLNISDSYSLHHLIDTAVSHGGSQRLREWFLHIRPNLEKMHVRRQLIQELVPLSRFRDKLLLNFRLVSREHLDGEKLLHWLQVQNPSRALRRTLPFSLGLALLNITLLAGHLSGRFPAYWLLSQALYLALYFYNMPKIQQSFDAVMLLYNELEKFKRVLLYLEAYPYKNTPRLQALCESFCHKKLSPSTLLKKIVWLTSAVGLRMNPMLGLALNLVLPWDLFFAFLAERYQNRCADIFPRWVDTWAELEALVSLANFAYLHPEYIFPELAAKASNATQTLIQATAMGHPLIPAEQNVCNDYSVRELGDVTLLTGSNMAGKSTFLKTVGINLCLAYAGGPVNAASFRTQLFRIFTCLQVHDSITDGFSFFYAEVRRLRQLMEAIQQDDQLPLFFFIDEIFRGTNSRERLIGSRAYIQHISTQRGIGIIATHDLELGQLAESIPGLSNAHFRDDVADGKMTFDYTLHPGLCPTTNALKIMHMEGLPVTFPGGV